MYYELNFTESLPVRVAQEGEDFRVPYVEVPISQLVMLVTMQQLLLQENDRVELPKIWECWI